MAIPAGCLIHLERWGLIKHNTREISETGKSNDKPY